MKEGDELICSWSGKISFKMIRCMDEDYFGNPSKSTRVYLVVNDKVVLSKMSRHDDPNEKNFMASRIFAALGTAIFTGEIQASLEYGLKKWES